MEAVTSPGLTDYQSSEFLVVPRARAPDPRHRRDPTAPVDLALTHLQTSGLTDYNSRMLVDAIISKRPDGWWHFTLPDLLITDGRPGGRPAAARGQATTYATAIDGAHKLVSLVTGIPQSDITINPITPNATTPPHPHPHTPP